MQIFVRGGEDAKDVHFIVVERSGKIICPATDASQLRTADALALRGKSDAQIFPTVGGILIRSASDDGRVIAATLYGASYLDRLNGVRKADGRRAVWYEQNGDTIRVGDTIRYTARKNISRASAAVGETGIRMTIAVDDPPASLARSLSLLLPLLMSVAAAFLGWLVVRWLLINPLVALQRVVATYQPGTVIEPPRDIRSASGEIAELGKAFQDMSQHVADHEEEMGAALQRQMKLTREVHHRVKNNVQIMSSLISLRARATDQADARAAYASIQRRVDALAVVQRNHYAELEENFGVSACPLISEIAASLRASVPESRPPIAILVDCDPVNMDQDVAAPVAFLIAELADIAIASHSASQLRIALIAEPEPARQARLSITSDAFDDENTAPSNATHLYQRILTGLSRQLRQPLTYDAEAHEYSIMLQILRDPSETFA